MTKQLFLGYEISNSGNSDGWVPTRANPYAHLGNFKDLKEARREVFVDWCLKQPSLNSLVRNWCLRGRGEWGDFNRVTKALENDGYGVPEEITGSTDGNFCTLWLGSPIHAQPNRCL